MVENCFYRSAWAKINLFLHVVGRDSSSGYHLIESLITFTSLRDEIFFQDSHQPFSVRFSSDVLSREAMNLIDTHHNTVTLMINLLSEVCHVKPRGTMWIKKSIPIGAGLGGGSADAAAAFRVLQEAWSLTLPDQAVDAILVGAGCDVPICYAHHTSIVKGVGTELVPCEWLTDVPLLIVSPGVPLSTAEIYQGFAERGGGFQQSGVPDLTFESLQFRAENALQPIAEVLVPEIKPLIQALRRCEGCVLARMTGSGPTCFALFKTVAQSIAAENYLHQIYPTHQMHCGFANPATSSAVG